MASDSGSGPAGERASCAREVAQTPQEVRVMPRGWDLRDGVDEWRSKALLAELGIPVPASRVARGLEDGQFVQRQRPRDEVGDFIKAFQPLVLFLELRGLLANAALQAAIHRLQLLGHVVEACCGGWRGR